MKKIIFTCICVGVLNASCDAVQLPVGHGEKTETVTKSKPESGEKIVLKFFALGIILFGANKRLGDYC